MRYIPLFLLITLCCGCPYPTALKKYPFSVQKTYPDGNPYRNFPELEKLKDKTTNLNIDNATAVIVLTKYYFHYNWGGHKGKDHKPKLDFVLFRELSNYSYRSIGFGILPFTEIQKEYSFKIFIFKEGYSVIEVLPEKRHLKWDKTTGCYLEALENKNQAHVKTEEIYPQIIYLEQSRKTRNDLINDLFIKIISSIEDKFKEKDYLDRLKNELNNRL